MRKQMRSSLASILYVLFILTPILGHTQQPSNAEGSGSQQQENFGPPEPPPRGGGPMNPEAELSRLSAALNLLDQQKAAILPILQQRHIAMEQLMHGSSDRAAAATQIHELMDSTNRQIRAQLTEAQAKIFDTLRPPRPPQGGGQEPGSVGSVGTDSQNGMSSGQQPPQGPPPDGGGTMQ